MDDIEGKNKNHAEEKQQQKKADFWEQTPRPIKIYWAFLLGFILLDVLGAVASTILALALVKKDKEEKSLTTKAKALTLILTIAFIPKLIITIVLVGVMLSV